MFKKLFKKLLFLVGISFFLLIGTIFASFTPQKGTSGSLECKYFLSGLESNSENYTKSWTGSCDSMNIDFDLLNVPDGSYYLKIRTVDSTTQGDLKTYPDGSGQSEGNKEEWISDYTYDIDRIPPTCLLKEIRFLERESNNQYYNEGKLYYRQNSSASGKFQLVIESDDTDNGTKPIVSKIDKIDFPMILGANPDTQSFTNSGKVIVTATYNWSGSHSDTFDILNSTGTQVCFDNASNSSSLKSDASTRVIFQDGNYDITGLSNLVLTPDSSVPTVDGVDYSVMINGIKFKGGNNGTGSETIIYNSNTGSSKYFSALDNRQIIIPKFKDEGSGLKTFKINIEKYDHKDQKISYIKTGSLYNSRVDILTNTGIIHNFSLVDSDSSNGYRNYDWNIETLNLAGVKVKDDEICDMVGNCVSTPTPYFRIVANSPIIATNTNITTGTNGTKHNLNVSYDGSNDSMRSNMLDTHTSLVYFEDKYGNRIIPVSGVKEVKLDIKFDNTLGCNQLDNSGSGDCVDFSFKTNDDSPLDGTSNPDAGEKYNFSYTLDNSSQFDGSLKIELKSGVPTKEEYRNLEGKLLYGSNLAKLQLNSLGIIVDDKTSYNGVGENNALEVATSGNQPSYKWNPIINYNKLANIYPLVEGQEKELGVGDFITDSTNISGFNIVNKLGTNNLFLNFEDIYLKNHNKNIIKGLNDYGFVNNYFTWYTSGYGSFPNTSYSANFLNFIPKTRGGIESNNTKVAIYSNIYYKVGVNTVILPGNQTGFKDFGPHQVGDFENNTNYSLESNVTLAEVDIRGTTQSKNTVLSGTGACSSDGTFKDYSSIKLIDLKTTVNKNIEKLLAGIDRSKGIVNGGVSTINSFDFSSQGGFKLQNNNVIYFKNTDVTISCVTNPCSISGKKTIIIENGNLTIKSDMKYTDKNSILGIILIGNKNGTKSKLKISENITNGVGIVYSEGPIVSVNNDGAIYNGSNTTATNLVNQLYWKGSFASRNTVGGAIKDENGVCPYGTAEYKNGCSIKIAQGYDLIYLRRYARVAKSYYSTIVGDPMGDGKIPVNIDKSNIKTAGGDSYIKNTGVKTLGDLPKPANYSTSDKAKNSPLILEYDSNLATNPPYGFNN